MDEASIRAFWEKNPCGDSLVGGLDAKYGGDYEDFFNEYDALRYSLEDHIPLCLDQIDFAGRSVLDIGLGQGADSEQIIRRGGLWTGLDLTQEAVDRVRTRLDLRRLPCQGIYRGSMMDMPFADETFDMIFTHGALPTVPDIEGAQREFARVLKPRGTLVIMVYAKHSLNYWLSIALLRRVGITFLYFTGIKLGGIYDVHLKQARANGLLRYLKMENFIHRNTDGPLNPYIRVHTVRDVERQFSLFRIDRVHKECMWAPPLHVKWLPLSRWLGWHLWVHLVKKDSLVESAGEM